MTMAREIRDAVLDYLRKCDVPASIGDMAEQIRLRNEDLRQVSDFDFRSTVLRMLVVGDIELTPANRITMPMDLEG